MTDNSVTFDSPVVDFVKFANKLWVWTANGDFYLSDDGLKFYKVDITVSRR